MASHLRNEDYTDRELLHVIHDCYLPDGYATSADVAERMGIEPANNRSPAGIVSSRLAWMTRVGLLERLDPKRFGRLSSERIWRITPLGDDVMAGRLPVGVERVIGGGGAGVMVLVMRAIALRTYQEEGREVSTVVRREHNHHAAHRRRW